MNHQEALNAANVMGFPTKTIRWLTGNWDIWDEFYKIADTVRVKGGRTRFGAFAIINVIRWNRINRDKVNTRFKISNECAAPMARLYNFISGTDFFKTKPAPSLNEHDHESDNASVYEGMLHNEHDHESDNASVYDGMLHDDPLGIVFPMSRLSPIKDQTQKYR